MKGFLYWKITFTLKEYVLYMYIKELYNSLSSLFLPPLVILYTLSF